MAVKSKYVFDGDLCEDPQTLINNGCEPTPVVTLADHEAALAEKDKEIEKLTTERDKYKMEALVKFDCQVCSGSLEDENEKLRTSYNTLLTEAVQFAELAEESLSCGMAPRDLMEDVDYQKVKAFLTRPEVQAVKVRQKEAREHE